MRPVPLMAATQKEHLIESPVRSFGMLSDQHGKGMFTFSRFISLPFFSINQTKPLCSQARDIIIVTATLAFLYPVALFAQNVEQGKKYFLQGEYEKAIDTLKGRRQSAESLVWLTYALEQNDDLEAAKAEISSRRGWQAYEPLLNRLGELELAASNYDQARSYFEQAFALDSTYLEARLNLGELEAEWGNNERARSLLQYFVDLYKITPYPDARLSFLTARACVFLNRFQDANDLFADASRQRNPDWRVFVHWGNIFLEKYNFSDALATFNDALRLNPNAVDAQIGLARTNEQTQPQSNPEIIKALLEKHPRRLDILNYAAHWALDTGDLERADEQIKKALKIAPQNLEALTLQAKYHLLQKDRGRFEATAQNVLKINPAYHQLFTEAGDLLARRYLFKEAVTEYRRALAINENDVRALAGLGTTLSRLAKLDEARDLLEKAFKLDPYNVWTKNLLDLFDSYKDYETIETEHFQIRLHKEDVDIVGPYAADLAERAYRAMVPRYKVTIDFPVTIEIFPSHDDFAVRCFGLPGSQAFLGICFGPLITMNSPRARSIGTFNWFETLWHEFAHVVHLTLTNNRIPRWMAEGIAVYEATTANPAWDMNFHLAMINALQRDKVIPLKELDSGFVGDPGRVTFSYYQSSQMVAFIDKQFGFDKLLAMLGAFRDGKDTPQAVQLVLGMTTEAFDEAFKQFLRSQFLKDGIDFSWDTEKLPQEPSERVAKLRVLVTDEPGNYFATLHLGKLLAADGLHDEAISLLEKAHNMFPEDVSQGSAYPGLIDAYLLQADSLKAVNLLSKWVDHSAKNYRAAMQLFELASALEQQELAQKGLETAIEISPYNGQIHKQLGEIFMAKGDGERAVHEFRIELSLKPTDKAGAHCRLAEAFLLINDKSEAKKHALLALEIAPTYAKAQEILLKSVQN